MHGSSSVPQEWLKIINDLVVNIRETYGVPVSEIQEGINMGFVRSILIPIYVLLQQVPFVVI